MSTTDLATVHSGPLAVAPAASPLEALATMSDHEFRQRLDAVKTAQRRMATIQREVMDDKTDYGIIPGTGNKPTLLKPGAEKLCKFHHLVPTFDVQTILGDGATSPHIRVLVVCSLHYETDAGPIVAQGLGASNSWEKKYRYREGGRKCPSCGASAIRRSRFADKRTGEYGWYCFDKAGGCGTQFHADDKAIIGQQLGQIENPDPFDAENTLQKMAAKRAQVDATLRATATSGLFTQDVEDMEPKAEVAPPPASDDAPRVQGQMPPAASVPRQASPPVAKPTGNGAAIPALENQVKAIYNLCQSKYSHDRATADELCKSLYDATPAQLTKAQAIEFIQELQKNELQKHPAEA